jgi:rod shape-determining protein MreD
MRWSSFFILAYVVLGLESGLARAIEFKGASPDLVLLAVVFLGLSAPRDTALLGCFILGLLHDFTSHGTLGLFAFSYGIAGLFVAALQQAVSRRHPLSHILLTAFVGMTTAVILTVHGWVRPPVGPAGPLYSSAIYSAIIAPLMIFPLQKMSGVFRFKTPRGRM